MRTISRQRCWHYSHVIECKVCKDSGYADADELDASFRNRIQDKPNILSFVCGHTEAESCENEGPMTEGYCSLCALKERLAKERKEKIK